MRSVKKYKNAVRIKRFFATLRWSFARFNGLAKNFFSSPKKEVFVFLSLILSINLYNAERSFNPDYIKKCL